MPIQLIGKASVVEARWHVILRKVFVAPMFCFFIVFNRLFVFLQSKIIAGNEVNPANKCKEVQELRDWVDHYLYTNLRDLNETTYISQSIE